MAEYIQISFKAERSDSQLITDAMSDAGAFSVTIESASEEDCFDEAAPGEPRWEKQLITALFNSSQDLQEIEIILSGITNTAPRLKVSELQDQDWERSWLKQFKPINVGNRLWVCPSWCDAIKPDDINLIIDPGLAFGTGTHPTTHLCLNYLSSASLQGKSVLDFGCGSGILGIAAAKLGADRVVGVDVDEKAISASTENALSNRVSSRVTALKNEQYRAQYQCEEFDIVIANILAGTLVDLSTELINRVAWDGTILLSGILHHQAKVVLEVYQPDFNFSTQQQNDWVLLIGRKNI